MLAAASITVERSVCRVCDIHGCMCCVLLLCLPSSSASRQPVGQSWSWSACSSQYLDRRWASLHPLLLVLLQASGKMFELTCMLSATVHGPWHALHLLLLILLRLQPAATCCVWPACAHLRLQALPVAITQAAGVDCVFFIQNVGCIWVVPE